MVDYIDAQFEAYLQEELKIKRSLSTYHDTRIHVCLYFICPTGHGLKSIDLVCMKKLDTKVNIVPIIAKADTISKTELQKFKTKIIGELQNNGVHIYQFPTDDENVAETNASMNSHVPFAVVGSTDFVKVGNKMMRSRQYPWGTVQGGQSRTLGEPKLFTNCIDPNTKSIHIVCVLCIPVSSFLLSGHHLHSICIIPL